jgi:hypothetical protein
MVKRYSVYLPHYETGEIEEMPDGEYVQYTDYAAIAERCERLQFVCQNVLGGILTGAIVCKPMMRKVNGDYVVEGVQEMLERVLAGEAP